MGSWISRTSDSSSRSQRPRLPFDIYLEVLNHLRISTVEDRKTLLALALCCRTLRGASQRILFSSMHYGHLGIDPDRVVHVLKVHSKFLRAVVDSPNRLALYVLSYSQHLLALDPKLHAQGTAHPASCLYLTDRCCQQKRLLWTTKRAERSSGPSRKRHYHSWST